MKYGLWLPLAAALCMCGAAAQGLLPQRVADEAAKRVANGQYPVLVIAVTDGEKTEIRSFGALPDGRAPDGDTVFEIGSVTKTFTGTLVEAVMRLSNLRTYTSVADVLKDYTLPFVGEPFGQGTLHRDITFVNLAEQRSGLPRMPTNFLPADPRNPYADYDEAKLKDFLAHYQLPRKPGEAYEYSNLGFALLGTALARKMGTDYRSLLKKTILDPLAMTSSDTVTTDAMKARLAPGHDETGKPQGEWDFDVFAPAGGIRSTANDMVKYLKANMGHGPHWLGQVMKSAQEPRADMDANTMIGFAWMTAKDKVIWHNGMTGGYACFLGFTKDRKKGVVILTNRAAGADDLGFATLLPESKIVETKAGVKLSEAALREYEGVYKLSDSFEIRLFYAGEQTLYAQATGQGAFQLFPSAKDELFARVADISFSIRRDAGGKIVGLTLHQNGDQQAVRADTPTVSLDPATLQSYVGKYQLGPGATIEMAYADGRLTAQLTGQPALSVYASAKDAFFLIAADAQIDFERDGAGKVVALVLHQNGRAMRAPRL